MEGDEKVYICPPDWWPEPIPDAHVLLLLKRMYGTEQAARRWHIRISDWMEQHGYPEVNSEKTIFMKSQGPQSHSGGPEGLQGVHQENHVGHTTAAKVCSDVPWIIH
jgi:hypothetical protein